MKYYSDRTKKFYDTEESCMKAEKAAEAKELEAQQKAKELKEARTARAKEVEDAFKTADEARKKAEKLLNEFLKDYGRFHTTVTEDTTFKSVWDLFDHFFFNF